MSDVVSELRWRGVTVMPGAVPLGERLPPDDLPALIRGGPVGALGRELFGEYVIPSKGMKTRTFPPVANADEVLPWHQDAYAFPGGWRFITAWILLQPADLETVTGLALIPHAFDRLIPKAAAPTNPAKAWMELDPAETAALAERNGIYAPNIRRGDAIVFDALTPHRTNLRAGADTRISVEVRLIQRTPEVDAEYRRNGIPLF